MRNLVLASAVIAILASTVGCANGPIRQWLRGAPCSTCNPQFAPQHESVIGGCNSGTCGTGILSSSQAQPVGNGLLSGIFGGQQNASALPPASIPASSFEAPPSFGATAPTIGATAPTIGGPGPTFETAPTIGSNIDLYGNTNSVGRIELPPSGPFN